jgi:membrane-associated protease RseP (regulator of RpoE activity)
MPPVSAPAAGASSLRPAAPLPPITLRETVVPILFFCATLVSTTAVGVRYMYNFHLGRNPLTSDLDLMPYQWVWQNRQLWASGFPFSITLIAILLAHEFGHYIACRVFGIRATLPYLMPAPSLSGSFGAIIRLKARVKTRAALIVIGASGPIAGFCVAIVTVALGLHYSTIPQAAMDSVIRPIQVPLLIRLCYGFMPHAASAGDALQPLIPHPILSASWMGLLITALNLIPAGQLDGGHIVYAVSRRAHRISTYLVVAALAVLGIVGWVGWLLWSVVLLTPAMRHPKVTSDERLHLGHLILVPICLVLLLVSGTPLPFTGYSLIEILRQIHS